MHAMNLHFMEVKLLIDHKVCKKKMYVLSHLHIISQAIFQTGKSFIYEKIQDLILFSYHSESFKKVFCTCLKHGGLCNHVVVFEP